MKLVPVFLLLLIDCLIGCKGQKKPESSSISSEYYTIGDSLYKQGNASAFYYFNKAVNNSNDNLDKARALNRMAAMQFDAGDHFGSQETVIESLKLLDQKNEVHNGFFLSNYNLLGRSNLEQKNYDNAINYFKKAELFLSKGQSNSNLLNNLALTYQKKGEYTKSIAIYQSLVDSSKNDTLLYARVLSNLARTKWLQSPSYNPVPEFLTALTLREIKKDMSGLNASYSHLSDYYAAHNPDSSLVYSKKMYEVAKSPDDKLEAIEKMIRIEPAYDVRNHFQIFYSINDSLIQSRNNSKYQFAAIRFESEKNKAENFLLQKDNFKQRVIIFSISILAIVIFLFAMTFYNRRKKRMERDTQNKIRQNQLTTSKKVHDVVANGLYRIMTNLEHKDSIEKEPLLDEIENLYEQSRDISYDHPAYQANDYPAEIHHLLSAFGTTDTKILIVGNEQIAWNKLSEFQKKELEYILQEIMVNMSKHSKAKNVVIRFAIKADFFTMYYKDDGVGFSSNSSFGNGLRNTENRIKSLGGTIIFDGFNGMKIEISIPTGKAND